MHGVDEHKLNGTIVNTMSVRDTNEIMYITLKQDMKM